MDWMDAYLDGIGEYKTTVSPADTHIWGVKPAPNAQQQRMLFDAAAQSETEFRQLVHESRQEMEAHGMSHADVAAGIGADPGSPAVQVGVNVTSTPTVTPTPTPTNTPATPTPTPTNTPATPTPTPTNRYFGTLLSYNFFNNRSNTLRYADPTLPLPLGTLSAGSMVMASGIDPLPTITTGWGSDKYDANSTTLVAAITANEYFTIPIRATGTSAIVITGAGGFTVNRNASSPKQYSFLFNAVFDNPLPGYANLLTNVTVQVLTPTEIHTQLNSVLSANPITIPAGSTAYMYVVPFSGSGASARATFINTDATSQDFKLLGYIL